MYFSTLTTQYFHSIVPCDHIRVKSLKTSSPAATAYTFGPGLETERVSSRSSACSHCFLASLSSQSRSSIKA